MPLPDLSSACIRVTLPPGGLAIQLPGGGKISATFPPGSVPTADELTTSLLAQANTALTPLVPIFDILDVLVSMVDCIKAVEQCLGPPPDPTQLVKCFPKLASAMAEVLKLVPQLSIPVLVGGILDTLIAFLQGVRLQLLAFIQKQLRIVAAQATARAIGSSIQLSSSIDCATANLEAAMTNLNQSAAAVGRLIALVNLLLGIAGLPELPTFADLGTDAQAALVPIDATIQLLTAARPAFP